MERKAYKTDLTDAQWQVIKPLIPPAKKGGRRRTVDIREIRLGYLHSFSYWMLVGNDTTRIPALLNRVFLFSAMATHGSMAKDKQRPSPKSSYPGRQKSTTLS